MIKRPLVAGPSTKVKAARLDGDRDDDRPDVTRVWLTVDGNW